jgi:hypothetical protein
VAKELHPESPAIVRAAAMDPVALCGTTFYAMQPVKPVIVSLTFARSRTQEKS